MADKLVDSLDGDPLRLVYSAGNDFSRDTVDDGVKASAKGPKVEFGTDGVGVVDTDGDGASPAYKC